MPSRSDIVILGAGVAGLAAAIELARSGAKLEILEARNRAGGRILTEQPRGTKTAIELGAEFIHGLAPEIWKLIKKHHLEITEFDGDNWCLRNGKLLPCDFLGEVQKFWAS